MMYFYGDFGNGRAMLVNLLLPIYEVHAASL